MKTLGAIIVASGHGSLREVSGGAFPKVLESVHGRPIIARILGTVTRSKLSPVVVVNPRFELEVRMCLHSHGFSNIRYAIQPERQGAADAVYRALPILENLGISDTMVIYADMPFWEPDTIQAIVSHHRTFEPTLTMATLNLSERSPAGFTRFGRVIRKDGRIQRGVEYKDATLEEQTCRVLNPCLWAWKTDWLGSRIPQLKPHEKGDGYPPELYLPDLIQVASDEGCRIVEVPLKEDREAFGINTHQDLVEAQYL